MQLAAFCKRIRWRVGFLNLAIAVLLVFMLCESAAIVPSRVRNRIAPATHSLGIWQTQWDMFAPEPDMSNHRIWAKVQFSNGECSEWHSPDWRKQTSWQRFTSHRLSEYLDAINAGGRSEAWEGFADFVARDRQTTTGDGEWQVSRVELWVRQGLVPDASLTPWPSVREPSRMNDQWMFYAKDYP